MKRMMCLWFPNWPVQWRLLAEKGSGVFSRNNPAGPSRKKIPDPFLAPLIVHGLSHGGKVRVIACSRAARQRGVAPGMLLAEAQSLWPSSASIWSEPHDPLADREKLKELAQACRLLSPEIAVDPSESPDCLLIDVTGREYCRDHEIEIAEEAIDSLAERGYWAAAAVADTVGVAWAVAHFARSKSRVFIIPPGQQAEALRRLPIEALRLPGPVVQSLRELNIARVDQLLALPRAELPARFGAQLLLAIDRALGVIPDTPTPERPNDPLEASWEFEPPVGDGQILVEVIEHLLERLLKRIPCEHSGVKRLFCSLKLVDRQSLSVPIELIQPSASRHNLMQLVRLQIERLQIPAEVSNVTVRADIIAPLEFEQDEMFSSSGSKLWKEVTSLLERMSSRLGPTAVLRPRRVPDPQPEFAWEYDDWLTAQNREAATRSLRSGARALAVSKARAPLRPTSASRFHLRLEFPPDTLRSEDSASRLHEKALTRPVFLKTPCPVAVVSIYPGGSPRRFEWSNRNYLVARSWGPELH